MLRAYHREYIYIYTHIHIYIYIDTSTNTEMLTIFWAKELGNYRLLKNAATVSPKGRTVGRLKDRQRFGYSLVPSLRYAAAKYVDHNGPNRPE